MPKKLYTITIKQGNHTIEVEKEYTEYEYSLISELLNDINDEVFSQCEYIQECCEDEDPDYPSLDLSIRDSAFSESEWEKKNKLEDLDKTIDNMTPEQCIDLFKRELLNRQLSAVHNKSNEYINDIERYHFDEPDDDIEDDDDSVESIDFSDVVSSRLVNQTGPSNGLILGELV